MCLVEVDGAKGVPASCTTPCSDGMVVQHPDRDRCASSAATSWSSTSPTTPRTATAAPAATARSRPWPRRSAPPRCATAGPSRATQVAHPHPVDVSNPYFAFDASSCIVCSRCVRACADIQGTFALTVEGRGFDSKISAGGTDFLSSECVSCGACVQACPTSALQENSVVQLGMPTRSVETTCAYCGVGCSFRAEVQGEGDRREVVRMVPSKDGGANEGHSCVKGRFAYGYAAHKDRQLSPDGARLDRRRVARGLLGRGDRHGSPTGFQAHPGRARRRRDRRHLLAAGAPTRRCTSSRRWCGRRSATTTSTPAPGSATPPPATASSRPSAPPPAPRTSASVEKADVILLIGANPTDAHPVFASRMKRRLRDGAELIVADPRRIDLVRSPHVEAAYHLPVLPGSNVAFVNAMAHVIVTEGLHDEEFVRERCEDADDYLAFIADPGNSPEAMAEATGIDARRAARGRPALRRRPTTPRSTTASASPSTPRARRW